ncbi:MAG: choice-of-anchor Q domain-containing protein [Candidatus Diapherotrites archaeon]|nr:choice-of-anchor Q domain-containing protein [Candidatus Diapherotrites archaeon]
MGLKLLVVCFALLLFSSTAFAAEWYVRPPIDTYGLNNGSSFENAWSGLENVVWGNSGINAGDTLFICGVQIRTVSQVRYEEGIIKIPFSGTSESSPITIRMDCPNGETGFLWGIYDDRVKNSNGPQWQGPDPNGVYSTKDFTTLGKGEYVEYNGTTAVKFKKMPGKTWVGNNAASFFESSTGTTFVKTINGGSPSGKIFAQHWALGYGINFAGKNYIKFYKCNFLGAAIQKYKPDDDEYLGPSTHIVFDNCVIKYYNEALNLYAGDNYWTIKNSEISNFGETHGAIYAHTPGMVYNLTVENNKIHDVCYDCDGSICPSNTFDCHAIGIQNGENHLIQGNEIWNTGEAISFWSDTFTMKNMTVRNNFIKNARVFGGENGTGGSGIVISGGSNATAGKRTGFKIYNNIIMNTGLGYESTWTGSGISSNNPDYTEIYNNVIYNPGGIGIRIIPALPFSGKIYNNIIVSPRLNYLKIIAQVNPNPGLIVSNNLYSPAVDYSNFAVSEGINFTVNSIFASPKFNISSPQNPADFVLEQSSPAIDKGVSFSGAFANDFSGTSRPQGTAWDIGAFESSNAPACLDLKKDGKIDILDLVFVISRFGNPRGDLADVVGNNGVDISDLQEVAAHFGQTC